MQALWWQWWQWSKLLMTGQSTYCQLADDQWAWKLAQAPATKVRSTWKILYLPRFSDNLSAIGRSNQQLLSGKVMLWSCDNLIWNIVQKILIRSFASFFLLCAERLHLAELGSCPLWSLCNFTTFQIYTMCGTVRLFQLRVWRENLSWSTLEPLWSLSAPLWVSLLSSASSAFAFVSSTNLTICVFPDFAK